MEKEGGADEKDAVLARRSPLELEVKQCPRCLSPLKSVTSDLLGFVPTEYYCTKCGYSGMVYVVKEKDGPQGEDERAKS